MSPRRAKAIRGRADLDPATALREHLINVAHGMLSERQVTAITTRDIARAANVSDGVLYNYFTDKNALLLAAMSRRVEQLVETYRAGQPRPGTGTVEANLTAYSLALRDLVVEALPIAAGLITEPVLLHGFLTLIHGTSPTASAEQLLPGAAVAAIEDYLAGEKDLGRVGEGVDTHSAATLLFGAAVVLAFAEHIHGLDPGTLNRQLADTVHTLVGGIPLATDA
jgi:AcrR family transcriptional regulator